MKLMREAGLSSKYSVETLVIELEKNRVMILPDGTKIVSERTRVKKKYSRHYVPNRRNSGYTDIMV